MDYAKMLRFHQERGAGATLAVIEVPSEEASRFGVLQVDEQDRITGFLEKPKHLPAGDQVLASMGIYIFDMAVLVPALEECTRKPRHLARLRQGHHPRADFAGPGLRLPLLRREQEGGEILARHRHAGRVLRSQHGSLPCEPGVQPLRSGMAAAHLSAAGAAGQVRVRRRGPALRAGARLDHLGRLHHLGQPHLGSVLCPNVRVHSFCDVDQAS